MIANATTKLIARIHKAPSARGLELYNKYFEEAGINAQYLLFYNNKPEKILNSLFELGFVGGNTAGYENDPEFKKYITSFDESSSIVGHVGYIKMENGQFKAYYAGGEGLFSAISDKTNLEGKNIVIVGAGNVSKSFIWFMLKKGVTPKSITVLNRTLEKAEDLAKIFDFKIQTGLLDEIKDVSGDILINATPIGSKVEDNIYNENIVRKFQTIVDVTFETENTNLINLGKKLNKLVVTGWDFFTFQGKSFLDNVLEIDVDAKTLKKFVVLELSK